MSTKWLDPYFPIELGQGVEALSGDFFFPCAFGQLGQPDTDDDGQRLAQRKEPIYKNRVPKLGGDEPEVKQDESENEEQDLGEDYWELRGDYLVRKHVTPRSQLYVPEENSCPFKLGWLNLYRTTRTSLPSDIERGFRDVWSPAKFSLL